MNKLINGDTVNLLYGTTIESDGTDIIITFANPVLVEFISSQISGSVSVDIEAISEGSPVSSSVLTSPVEIIDDTLGGGIPYVSVLTFKNLNPSDIIYLVVYGCEDTSSSSSVPSSSYSSSVSSSSSSSIPENCTYVAVQEDFQSTEPDENGDVEVDLGSVSITWEASSGSIIVEFDDERLVTSLNLELGEDVSVELFDSEDDTIVQENAPEGSPTYVPFIPAVETVSKIVITADDNFINLDDILLVFVDACQEETTPVLSSSSYSSSFSSSSSSSPSSSSSASSSSSSPSSSSSSPSSSSSAPPTTSKECVEFGPWMDWSPCSVQDCGLGTQTRDRLGYGPYSLSDLEQERDCYMGPCKVDCQWDSWADWSVCSQECGGEGSRYRSRTIDIPASEGGDECDGPEQEVEACNRVPCGQDTCASMNMSYYDCSVPDDVPPSCPVSCEDEMGSESVVECVEDEDDCVPGCYCQEGELYNGEFCVPISDCQVCYDSDNNERVPGESWADNEKCIEYTCVEGEGVVEMPLEECNRDCVWSEWSEYGVCSATCGDGVQLRYREILVEARGNGSCLGEPVEAMLCSSDPCPTDVEYCETTATPSPYCDLTQKHYQEITLYNEEHGECIVEDVDLSACEGSCPSFQKVNLNLELETDCRCCQGDTGLKPVKVYCPDDDSSYIEVLPYHVSCGCKACLQEEDLGQGVAP